MSAIAARAFFATITDKMPEVMPPANVMRLLVTLKWVLDTMFHDANPLGGGELIQISGATETAAGA